MKDLKKWELFVRMKSEGIITDDDIEELVEDADVDPDEPMDLSDFEAIMIELENRSEDDEEDEDEQV